MFVLYFKSSIDDSGKGFIKEKDFLRDSEKSAFQALIRKEKETGKMFRKFIQ